MVLSCIDPRFQGKVSSYLKKRKLGGKYSSFTIAGSAIGVTHNRFKNWHKTFIDNLTMSIKLHQINRLIVINHKDCGAAKLVNGDKEFDKTSEKKIHIESFKKLKKILRKKFPELYCEFYLMNLNFYMQRF